MELIDCVGVRLNPKVSVSAPNLSPELNSLHYLFTLFKVGDLEDFDVTDIP